MRITTWNVHFGKNPEAIGRALRSNPNLAESDVILLQEVESYPHEGESRAERIAEQLEHHCAYAPARETKKRGNHGIAILSRFPIEQTEVIDLPFVRSPWGSKKRIALIAHIACPEGIAIICNVHLDVRINHLTRIEQLRSVVNKLKEYAPAPMIMGGDFNTSPFYFAFKSIPILPYSQRKRVHSYLTEHGFSGFARYDTSTYRGIPMKLDHLYANGAVVERCGVERGLRVSDHKPVWADIRMEFETERTPMVSLAPALSAA